MGPEPDEPKHVRRGLGIDQQEVGPEMAIPIARPISRQGMVAVPERNCAVVYQALHLSDEPLVEVTVAAIAFAL